MKVKNWLWILLLSAIAVFVLLRLYRMGAFSSSSCESVPPCSVISNIGGPEDMAADRMNGFLYVSSLDRCSSEPSAEKRGRIFLVNFGPERKKVRDITPAQPSDFHPQGIDLYTGPEGRKTLFAVNHRKDGSSTIEIFDLPAPDQLSHRMTVADPLLIWPNDLTAVGHQSFFLTNVSRYGRNLGRKLDAFLGLKGGYIAFYDGHKMKEVASGLAYPNGIQQDVQKNRLYLTETLSGMVKVFAIGRDGYSLTLKSEIKVQSGLDNLSLDQEGRLWVAAHDDLLNLNRHLRDPVKPSSARIYRLDEGETGWKKKLIYCLPGSLYSGGSTALLSNEKIFVGSVCGPGILQCPLPTDREAETMSTLEWKRQGSYLEIDGRRVFYRSGGMQGEHLLLLHAFPVASWGW
ncbi:MAG: SMP-30/gluconolactonase/LRE family protein, partial [Saprospiraceae bacterium]|nr:SMP-30/gluconolactonase/LRE family protein [Saprospiraceae bacterium]